MARKSKIYERKKLYIITGAYGKTGKTSASIAIGLHFAKLGKKVRFIDTNPQNPDIGRIFDFFHKANSQHKYSEIVGEYEKQKRAIGFGKEHFIEIVTPTRPAESFEECIYFVGEVNKSSPDVDAVIVDTNHHISVTSVLKKIFLGKKWETYKKVMDEYDIIVIHFWDFIAISYLPELSRTREAVKVLEKMDIVVINVFSAHMMQMLSVLTFRSGKASQKNLSEMEKMFAKYVKQCGKCTKILFPFEKLYQFLKIASNKAYMLKGKDAKTISENYPKIWMEVFDGIRLYMKKKYDKDKCCPVNILLIPYFRDMIGFVNRVSVAGVRNLQELEKMMKDYYPVFENILL